MGRLNEEFEKLQDKKEEVKNSIEERHKCLRDTIEEMQQKVFGETNNDNLQEPDKTKLDEEDIKILQELDDIGRELDELLASI